MILRYGFSLLILFGWLALAAQSTEADNPPPDSLRPERSLIVLPLVFYTPETDWGFGAAGLTAFRFAGQDSTDRPSQLQLGAAYTLNKQWLFYLPFQLFYQQYKFYGELGYYRYSYFYYGRGQVPQAEELYSVNYPRVRLNALYSPKPWLFVGLRYWMDDFDITEVEAGGLLDRRTVTGAGGGLVSGMGPLVNIDTRDQLFYPSQGWLAEAVFFFNQEVFGSDFNFQKIILDISRYQKGLWKGVVATNLYAEITSGDPPFNQLAQLGGTRRMRAYYEGYLRDKQMVIFQFEHRWHLFWRMGMTVFGGYGGVARDLDQFNLENFLYNYGLGIRFRLDEKEKINLRLDAGFGKEQTGFYLTIGEAF